VGHDGRRGCEQIASVGVLGHEGQCFPLTLSTDDDPRVGLGERRRGPLKPPC
jgi:hypothetical protein